MEINWKINHVDSKMNTLCIVYTATINNTEHQRVIQINQINNIPPEQLAIDNCPTNYFIKIQNNDTSLDHYLNASGTFSI